MAEAAAEATSIFGPLGRAALASLADFAAGMAGPVAFLGVLFLPTNRSLVTEGTLPGRPDLSWRYDRDTGVLDLYRQGDAGGQPIVSGHLAPDGLFHDGAGRVIGRSLGPTVVVDPDALPAPLGRTGSVALAPRQANAISRSFVPTGARRTSPAAPQRSLAYQEQIARLPRGFEVKLNNVRFDGCREEDGTMLEAKGPGYANKMIGPETWQEWYTGVRPIEHQMKESKRKWSVG